MNNIFDKMKSFSFINEASEPENPTNDDFIFLYVPDTKLRNALKQKMAEFGAEVRPAPNLEKPGSTKLQQVVIDVYAGADVRGINDYIEKMGDSAKRISLTDAHKVLFYQYYHEITANDVGKLKHARKVIDDVIKGGGKADSRLTASVNNQVKAARKRINLAENNLNKIPDNARKKQYSKEIENMGSELKNVELHLRSLSDEDINRINSMFKTINYSDKDIALNMLVRVKKEIDKLKHDGVLDDLWNKRFNNKLVEAQHKLGMPEEEFNSVMATGIGDTLAYYIFKFIYTQQKTEEEISEQYAMVQRAIESERKVLDPESYDKMKQLVYDEMVTKVALLKGIKEKEEGKLGVNTGEPTKGESSVAIVPTSDVSNEYVLKVRLPIGQDVVITDMERFRGKRKGKSKKEEEMEMLRKSILARTEVTLFNLMGYTPKGVAAGVVAAYDPFRQHMGEVTEVFARNTIGLIGLVTGRTGKDAGEGIGRFLKYELIGEPSEVNPALAQGEMWLRNKFNVHSAIGLEPTSKSAEANSAKLLEDAAPAAAPGGDGMNTPGMIGNAGNPHAPTPDQKPAAGDKAFASNSGSGDDFNPRKKKDDEKKEQPGIALSGANKVNENVLDFNSFRSALYDNK